MPPTAKLKDTLNLPRTDFPMKANLPQTEPRQLAEWESAHIYEQILAARAGAPVYVFHDGPPYPTGNIHLGTALNKTLKDMVVRSKCLAGFRAGFIPGWDCHGLPIETQVEKEMGGKKGEADPVAFRKLCRAFANKYVDAHRIQFKRLGIFARWDQPYLTMDPHYEAVIANTFLTVLERGYVYRGRKPVYWCIYDRTALAEAEVEYEDHSSPSIWVKFQAAAGGAAFRLPGADVAAVIWTTTPWTLPHNRALAFHPDFVYAVYETTAGRLLMAEAMAEKVAAGTGLKIGAERGRWKGRELEGLKFRHPFLDLEVPAVLGDYVTTEQGSGIVHTAPGHGAEDFYTGQKYGLETYAPLDDDGRYLEGLPEYKGKTVFEANPEVTALLRRRGALLGEGKITHSYPHCWRCHRPVIFRATEQWFIGIDNNGLRKRTLEEIHRVKWMPGWGEERMGSMVGGRPDWCISRQRYWGVPIVVFYCDACGTRLEDVSKLRHVIPFFEKEGADAWYAHSPEELLPPGTTCSCGAAKWRRETDILDVWFDSGSSHMAVLTGGDARWPADMYLEGPDQYRGWFHSSLLIGMAAHDGAPYREILTHGWTLDEHGRPMSKSLGNIVLPSEIMEKYGADMLRLWVASQDYTADVRMSDRVMAQLSDAYRKIRNTFRFALGNLAGYEPARDALPAAEMLEMDRWMLERTRELAAQCAAWYASYEFHRVFHAVQDFCTVELSAFYFDVLKDRLYTFAPRSPGRRSAQTAVETIARALASLLAPICVFTTEEVWKYMPRRPGDPTSVHMTLFPSPESLATDLAPDRISKWQELLGVRENVLKALEAKRNAKEINGSLEARVLLRAGGALGDLLREYERELPALFIVSQVEVAPPVASGDHGSAPGPAAGLQVDVERARGQKCERCWNYSERVGENAEFPTVCERCVAALDEITKIPTP
ncbi:MAG TPA: isoleucine--tRNA ligase [Candidatus Acidoferrales bacterium]|nr:isoleucine--tRNA ligase [Candidatus Acidoferrales bacterium]